MSGLDWTEELKKRTGIDFLTTRPMEIEKKSFEIIKGELGDEFVSSYPAEALPVLCRVIHTTAGLLKGPPVVLLLRSILLQLLLRLFQLLLQLFHPALQQDKFLDFF